MSQLPFDTVICPVDGSASSEHAAAFAGRLAEAGAARLVLLFAFPSSAAELMGRLGYDALQLHSIHLAPEDVERAMEEGSGNAFARARAAMGAVDAQIEEEVLRGEPAEAIVEYARGQTDAIIVMGSRGQSQMRELLLGSVSDRVVRHAPCPVTVVR